MAGRIGVGVAFGASALGLGALPASAATSGFRWCRRCQSLWFIDGGNNGHCPVTHLWDHSHYRDSSGAYVLRRDVEPGAGQAGGEAWNHRCRAAAVKIELSTFAATPMPGVGEHGRGEPDQSSAGDVDDAALPLAS